ncbi:tail fiber protein [Sphingomonas sp. AOB5]|uniref:phage tail protein n=1 Tax=Sphingomonas sp. AOB5 TaxID=3034017 RepID=UPI0023F7A6B3|nr:tail fiber protein [Sphingomonas sp. AOB5]MDF7774902.1 tail fiber protein [Sphingomonas sp. AOB5]
MDDIYMGEVRAFAFGLVPVGWVPCDGRTLPIGPYAALFALLGTTYGGNGTTTFGVPNLAGRVPVGRGQMPDGANYVLGAPGGLEEVALTAANLPPHQHNWSATNAPANTPPPTGNYLAGAKSGTQAINLYGTPAMPDDTVQLAADSISSTGAGKPHANVQPYLATQYCMSTIGMFPSSASDSEANTEDAL